MLGLYTITLIFKIILGRVFKETLIFILIFNLIFIKFQCIKFREYPLQKEMATHSSILTWETLWTEESGRLQSMVSQRIRPDLGSKQ